MATIFGKRNKNSKLRGTNGEDALIGENGNDTLYGLNGPDQLYGGDGNDKLYGGAGDDILDGNKGNDTLFGQNGDDFLYEGSGRNFLYGQQGADIFGLHGGTNFADGGSENDEFYSSGRQNSTLVGGNGHDFYGFGIDLADPFASANPTGVFTIRENFREANWGTIGLQYLNVNLVRPGNGPLADRNNLYVKDTGNDILLRVVYADPKLQTLDIYVENTNWGNVSKNLVLKNPE